MTLRIVAIIPARQGSVGLPDKNRLDVGGKPLLVWSVLFAKAAVEQSLISDVYISTDSAVYEALAVEAGAFSLGLRSESLSGSSVKTVDVVLDLVDQLEKAGSFYDAVLVLQPTTPEREVQELLQLIAKLEDPAIKAVISVSRFEEPHPYKLKMLDDSGCVRPFIAGTSSEIPRQELPPVYRLTGAYYLIDIPTLKAQKTLLPEGKTAAIITPQRHNIDGLDDLERLRSQDRVLKGLLT